jgi:hypothetical protein
MRVQGGHQPILFARSHRARASCLYLGTRGCADRSVVDHVLLVTTQGVGCSGKPDGSTRAATTTSIGGDVVDPAAAVDDLAFGATNSASSCSIG